MNQKPKYGIKITDDEWGCEFVEILCNSSIKKVCACHVKIEEIVKIATELTKSVHDTSWIISLDKGARRSYERTAAETAQELTNIFKKAANKNGVEGEFGELLVSMSSSRALKAVFNHLSIPIAELWKPQKKQNEGFDFHTVCSKDFINFGEAKYSSNGNPHGNAISQANDFFADEKHYRDRVHLINLVSKEAIKNLDLESFGVVAAFSINAVNPLRVFKNAIETTQRVFLNKNIQIVYLVGVSH